MGRTAPRLPGSGMRTRAEKSEFLTSQEKAKRDYEEWKHDQDEMQAAIHRAKILPEPPPVFSTDPAPE